MFLAELSKKYHYLWTLVPKSSWIVVSKVSKIFFSYNLFLNNAVLDLFSPSANNAKITFGAKDITNCQDDWYFTDIQPLDVQTVKTRNYWALPASKLQINNTTYRDQSLVISTEGGGVWGPKTIIDSVMKDLMEKMNISAVPLTMGCHQTVWPTFKFTVNSRVFEIQPRDYIQEVRQFCDIINTEYRV